MNTLRDYVRHFEHAGFTVSTTLSMGRISVEAGRGEHVFRKLFTSDGADSPPATPRVPLSQYWLPKGHRFTKFQNKTLATQRPLSFDDRKIVTELKRAYVSSLLPVPCWLARLTK